MQSEDKNFIAQHYYGDIVRTLFLLGAIIMLVFLPKVNDYLHILPAFSIFTILVLALASGFTNPKLTWSAVANVVIASAGFVIFEFYSVRLYRLDNAELRYLIVNLILGFIFLIAIYFSTKTLRARLMPKDADKPDDSENQKIKRENEMRQKETYEDF